LKQELSKNQMTEETDWDRSADAWIASLGEHGDWGRINVVDPALDERFGKLAPRYVLDVGCGEGRLCRKLQKMGIRTVGIDPTAALIEHAKRLDATGVYHIAGAEALPFSDGQFDCVVSCLSLIDIADIDGAISEMVRVLAPGGVLLIVNLTSFNTAGAGIDWQYSDAGERLFYPIDRYLEERTTEVEWADIRVVNHHRPLSRYMKTFLKEGLILEDYDEPEPTDLSDPRAQYYRRAPWINLMQWRKP